MRAFVLASLAATFALASGCGPACNSSNLCAIEGKTGEETLVCDGSSFVSCGDDNRGQIIYCGNLPRRALCGSGGWSFEYATPASQ